jgi:predicted histone-like DNA-binding protein
MKKNKIPYTVIARKNPQNGDVKYYANLTNRYNISMKELLKDVTAGSSINPLDAQAVLQRFLSEIGNHLQYGRTVSLDGLGSFYITVKSNGTETPEEFTAGNIRTTVCRVKAGNELRAMLDHVQFEKIENGTEASES